MTDLLFIFFISGLSTDAKFSHSKRINFSSPNYFFVNFSDTNSEAFSKFKAFKASLNESLVSQKFDPKKFNSKSKINFLRDFSTTPLMNCKYDYFCGKFGYEWFGPEVSVKDVSQ